MKSDLCEGHLTYAKITPRAVLRDVGKKHGFHFSWIDGWDELGEGRHLFLTSHGDFEELDHRMNVAMQALDALGFPCVRKKIEITVTDHRYAVDA